MAGLLGIVGGMTWRSTLEYYRLANERAAEILGETHGARVLVGSVDFGEILAELSSGRPERVGTLIVAAARGLEAAGADLLLLAANTAHRWFPEVAGAVGCPVLHVADPVLDAAAAQDWRRLALLATSATVAAGVYSRAAIEILTPVAGQQRDLDELILTDLVRREARQEDLVRCEPVVRDLLARGAQAVVLGCTELHPLAAEFGCPVLDSTALHVAGALRLTVHNGG